MAITIDPLLCMIFSGVMFFCSGFATYGCYRCYTDMEEVGRTVPVSSDLGLLKRSKERYRLRLFRRRPSAISSDATIYSVHSSEIWSRPLTRETTPRGSFNSTPTSSAGPNPTMFVNASQIRGWTIKEENEPEEEANENRRKSAPT